MVDVPVEERLDTSVFAEKGPLTSCTTVAFFGVATEVLTLLFFVAITTIASSTGGATGEVTTPLIFLFRGNGSRNASTLMD